MKLFALTTVAMIAFAANSVLNRLALADGAIDPASFAVIRVISGAVMLSLLVLASRRDFNMLRGGRVWPVLALVAYLVGFSFAYVSLATGAGALILFGGVQVTMFAGALIARDIIPPTRWIGAALAFAGLAYLLWPSGDAPNAAGAVLMAIAAVGWGIYSLLGRGVKDPLAETAANFVLATPLCLLAFVGAGATLVTPSGIVLAVVSGALTSGLGYALWYAVIPALGASRAAVSQLTVPIIAAAGGAIFLSEGLTLRFVIAAGLVLGGVLISLRKA